jgi:CrcB protein
MDYLLVFIGGGIGSLCRFAVNLLAVKFLPLGVFPLATFAVNMTGCFLIGIVAYLAGERAMIPSHVKLFLTVGFLGGFTTFSSFGLETFDLLRHGHYGFAFGNAIAQLGIGTAGVWAGFSLAAAIAPPRVV